MMTVSEVAKILGVSKSSIRTWSSEFEQFLSGSATPESGETRQYQEGDVATLYVIQQLRDQGVSYEGIHQALREGAAENVVVPARIWQLRQELPEGETITLPREFIERLFSHLDAQLEMLREERNQMRSELREMQAERLEAEKRAAAAEARAQLLEKLRTSS